VPHAAKVRSIDALQQLAAALVAFADEANTALEDLGMDLHRAVQWIQCDQKEYWTQEMRRAEQQATEARINLERRRMFRIGDQTPACDEEKKALEMARRRLERARKKLEIVHRWGRVLAQEAMECRGEAAPLASWLQTDLPRAVDLLRRMETALDSYVGSAAVDGSQSAVGSGEQQAAGDGQPAVDGEQPAAGSGQPAADGGQRTEDIGQPGERSPPPTADCPLPTNEQEEPRARV
jgi:hypothetical protein